MLLDTLYFSFLPLLLNEQKPFGKQVMLNGDELRDNQDPRELVFERFASLTRERYFN